MKAVGPTGGIDLRQPTVGDARSRRRTVESKAEKKKTGCRGTVHGGVVEGGRAVRDRLAQG